ncbi:carbamoyltransferase [PVC group bacterium]|nr:carbamoyltransferase [PVC group bacterium]
MYILGISAYYHDSAACLIKDGEILFAAQEERFTRKKHDSSFPSRAIRFCLNEAKITSHDLSVVSFYEKPFLKFERLIETYLDYVPIGFPSFLKAIPIWLKQKLWIKDLIRQELPGRYEILFPAHHASHAASAFYPSPFKESAILTVDGVGEWQTCTFGVGRDTDITLENEIRFPHSLGLLYSAFTYYVGFRVNSGEYKLMGLAPYGEPSYEKLIRDHLIDIKEDGSFHLNMSYFNYGSGLTMTHRKFHKLFGGKPRKPETKITQKEMDIARSIQNVTEDIMVKMARHIRKETKMKNLCLAGGVALNCVANGKILKDGSFEKIWIQPASGDAGGALGAALIAWYQNKEHKRHRHNHHDDQKLSLLGPCYKQADIQLFLDRENIKYKKLEDEVLFQNVAGLIAQQNVIGWFRGPMEFGARALGARSIIADPRDSAMQAKLNLKIKFRESFRPFAPVVLNEKKEEYFDLKEPSPYMLLVADVASAAQRGGGEPQGKEGFEKLSLIRSMIPSVTHVDYSSRVQTVDKADHPDFYQLIKAFEDLTACPVLINTSFNVRGEPIVCSPEDAWRCFMRTGMDYLVLENFLIDKKDQPEPETVFRGVPYEELD